jgi:hypothetical protein
VAAAHGSKSALRLLGSNSAGRDKGSCELWATPDRVAPSPLPSIGALRKLGLNSSTGRWRRPRDRGRGLRPWGRGAAHPAGGGAGWGKGGLVERRLFGSVVRSFDPHHPVEIGVKESASWAGSGFEKRRGGGKTPSSPPNPQATISSALFGWDVVKPAPYALRPHRGLSLSPPVPGFV